MTKLTMNRTPQTDCEHINAIIRDKSPCTIPQITITPPRIVTLKSD